MQRGLGMSVVTAARGGGRGERGGGRGEKPLLASSPVKNCEISDWAAKIYARILILLDPACQELRD